MSLEIIIGCMWSGKTTELFRRVKRLHSIGMKILIVNNELDVRNNNSSLCMSHDGNVVNHALVENTSVRNIADLYKCDISKYDVIAIDEGQFFSDLIECKQLVNNNKHVIISGLNGDSNQNKFGSILDLISFADDVSFMTALCKKCNDGTKGIFSLFIGNNKDISCSQISVGAGEKYMAVCRRHLNN